MVNRVVLIGNLCADPELKHTNSGTAVTNMRVATNERWTDKDGNKQEKAEFHSVTCWGKTAENCAQYLKKGRQVYIEGKLQTRDWDDKDTGQKRYRTEIVALTVQFLGGKGGATRDDDAPSEPETDAPSGGAPDDGSIPF